MKPQYCWLCNRDFRNEWFHTRCGDELLQFADYAPLPDCWVGQPQGLEWFCRDHVPGASELSHLTSSDALATLQARFGTYPEVVETSTVSDSSLWVLSVGPKVGLVFSIIHQASGRSASEAISLLRSVPFELARGWPKSFEVWRTALVAAGASVEIRWE